MTDFDFSDYYDAYAASTGDVQLEFVDPPALRGEDVEWTFRTTIRNELGPHDVGATRVNPLQYTWQDGDYYLTITVGADARNVAYRVHERHVSAP